MTPTLTDGVVTLRPWRGDDVDALVAICADPEIQRFTRVPSPYTRDDAVLFLAQQVARESRGELAAFAIADRSGDALLGSIDARRIDPGRALVGYLVGPQARGRGVATRALRLVAGWALGELGVARVEVQVRTDNPASRAVAERAGFRREGVLRSHLELKGRRYDAVVFSLGTEDVGSTG